ncbi:universal stress protein [Streptomyces beihaiensis]|uniref:Universal stress protein n=1 Tax=Streptomyces beihaiensis TaxID=2984495 RepID=A0ABT3TXE6_9ACTN|nr:universal stress protein [Streptomyces beihaiensis]MCX3061727.1 universal stress protein [Streptomyces beihaiensis]
MTSTVTAGLDGSPESRTAAEWAAREAQSRGLPLRLVHVWEPMPSHLAQAPFLAGETRQRWTEELPEDAVDAVRAHHPGLEVHTDELSGDPAKALIRAADEAQLMVLGSRGFGTVEGFVAGSVSLTVIGHAVRPVVLVRAPGGADDVSGPVVLGLDLDSQNDTLLDFAFEAAARGGSALRVVHAWGRSPSDLDPFRSDAHRHGLAAVKETAALTKALRPWRLEFPDVEVVEASRCGSAAQILVDDCRGARLAVVGRHIRPGAHASRVGHVAHAVIHHVQAPVAVVAHE